MTDTTNLTLDEMIALRTKEAGASKASPKGGKGKVVGSAKLTFNGMAIFTRTIWAESTSQSKASNDINDALLGSKDKAKALLTELLKHCELEISGAEYSDVSLADMLAALSTK